MTKGMVIFGVFLIVIGVAIFDLSHSQKPNIYDAPSLFALGSEEGVALGGFCGDLPQK